MEVIGVNFTLEKFKARNDLVCIAVHLLLNMRMCVSEVKVEMLYLLGDFSMAILS